MYLKKIEAHGFKSFADKIEIDLNQGITGIVGPNGSGKSNIVDAVRWVMGEQSIKSLRGSDNMADVIFSGSKSRNPLGVASVTLTFDNTDKYLPLDYEEVAIKRRVYKDGTNEYFINNEKCRLKDITDLLLDSGLAKESFNIIGQGKIEEIIADKPLERRTIFEEAAGVLKYKRRKEEALRKLDRTHENMTRVSDIIKELETQIEPLKQAREIALKYQDINNKLTSLDIALIATNITKLNATYEVNKEHQERLNNEILSLATKSSSREASTLELKGKLNDINASINQKQNELLDITKKVEQLNSKRLLIIEREKLDHTVDENNILRLTEQVKNLELNHHNTELKIASLSNELDGLKNALTLENNNLDKLRIDRQNTEFDLSNKLRSKNTLDNEIKMLQEDIDSNATLPYAVKSVLNNPRLRGIKNSIGGVIEVDEKYAKAISIALGISSTYVICDSNASAKEAINYLKNNKLGRATFFPMDIIKSRYIDSNTLNTIKGMKGFISSADKLVKFDPIYSNIITNQLGTVLIVDNIDNANVINKALDYKFKIVTLDGELLHIGGSITGGETNNNRNIITDRYKLEEKINALHTLENDISILEDKINIQDTNLKSAEDSVYVKNKELVTKNTILTSLNNELQSLNTNLVEQRGILDGAKDINNDTLKKSEEDAINEYYNALKTKDDIQNTLTNLKNNQSSIMGSIDDVDALHKKENTEFNTKNNELKDLEIEANRIDVKLDTLLNTLSETYSITYEKASTCYTLDMDENLARNTVNSYKREIKDLGIVNIGAIEEYDRVSTRYEFLINQQNDLTKAEDTLLEIIKEMDEVMVKEFTKSFNVIKDNFNTTFKELFHGGSATLELTDPTNMLETGIDIIASPPGKKLTTITLLSGGEKSLTALSLLFAILKSRPVPFVILDEVEAALDDVNVSSFGEYLNTLKDKTEFIIITHKKKTMEYADTLYGITMQESGVSKLVSVRLEDLKK
jgi:chromosome segregation protein